MIRPRSSARRPAIALVLLGVLSCASDDASAPAPAPEPEPCEEIAREEPLPEPGRFTARWAFEPWISKDISDRWESR
jgi:hypothetical protein